MALTCDVTNEEQVMHMVGQTIDMYGKVDVLVNNAGVMVRGKDLLDIMPDEWDQSVDTNLKGTYLCCRTVVPTMIEQEEGASSISDQEWEAPRNKEEASLQLRQGSGPYVQLLPGSRNT
ncbi:MAG: hypothetical protein Ct9H300mP11_19290 [Chloroflexota bacterium]|nr:MAG: hypothetical protein Ct9H300mP11_19290 [Chloroflexota bacterium]